MKQFVTVMTILLLSAGLVFGKAYDVSRKAGDYSVELAMEKGAVQGKNDIEITVRDAGGLYVTDAKVTVTYSMPAMSGMPAMNYNAGAELHGNAYRAVLDTPMSGSWTLTVKVTRSGKTVSARFTVDAR
jgi:hypothetical protein